VGGGAGGVQAYLEDALGIGDHAQAALLADEHEAGGDAGGDLVRGAVEAADLLVGDQLQTQRVRQRRRQRAEDLGQHQRRHLHVLRAAAVEPVAVPPGRIPVGGHDVEVGVEQHPEVGTGPGQVHQGTRLAPGGEALHRETGPDDVEHELQCPAQLLGTVGGGGHSDQLGGAGRQVHAPTLTSKSVAALPGGG
jgi:hypothetical protein